MYPQNVTIKKRNGILYLMCTINGRTVTVFNKSVMLHIMSGSFVATEQMFFDYKLRGTYHRRA